MGCRNFLASHIDIRLCFFLAGNNLVTSCAVWPQRCCRGFCVSERKSRLFPPFTTIWPKGQMGYFRNAPSENQWANRGAQLLFVVVGGSLCSSVCLIAVAGGVEGSATALRGTDRDKRDGEERRLWGWGSGGGWEIEKELRPVEIHHDVRHTDTLQPQIHHCGRGLQAQLDAGRVNCRGRVRRGQQKKRAGRQMRFHSWPKSVRRAAVGDRSAWKTNTLMLGTVMRHRLLSQTVAKTQPCKLYL